MGWGQFISGIDGQFQNCGIDYLKKKELELRNLEVSYKNKFHPQINLPFLQR